MTFDELFRDHNLTLEERQLLVLRLAQMRYERTVEVLMPVLREGDKSERVVSR